MSTLTPTPESTPSAPVLRDTTVVRNFRTGTPEKFRAHLNSDLDLCLSETAYRRILTYYKNTAYRDPTVGELRLLDGLERHSLQNPDCIAVGELTTQSSAIAETWADMMHKHGILHGAGEVLKSDKSATPPCTLTDALALTGRYLRRAELTSDVDDTVLLSAPWQEAVAAASGYYPVARLTAGLTTGDETRSLWVRRGDTLSITPCRTGDFILYLPRVKLHQIRALVESETQKVHPALGDIRAVAEKCFLLTLMELCPAIDIYAGRLTDGDASDGRMPLALLCGTPAVEADGTCGYLLRVPLKQVQAMNQALKDLGLSATVCGQVRTGGNAVVLLRDKEGKRDIPAVTLPCGLLRSMTSAKLYTMTPEAVAIPSPAPIDPPMTRFPSAVYAEDGLTPNGRETVALTRHEGRILRIPEEDLLMTVLSVTIPDGRTAFLSAADTAAATAKELADFGIDPAHICLSVKITADPAWLTDGRVLAAICGVYCAAAQLALPVEDPIITAFSTDAPLCITVTAWERDRELCANVASIPDRQWHTSGQAVHKESPAYVLPVLRRSYEDSLKALSAALNRNGGAACVIRPLAMDPICDEDTSETRYILHPESEQKLAEELSHWVIPVFSMNEEDTRLVLSAPAVAEALRRRVEKGWSMLVLGESCKVFAEWGFLPSALVDTRIIPANGYATVTYSFPSEPSARCLRTPLLASDDLQDGMTAPHLLTLHLPDGTAIPDGFVGCGGKVLGLLNGLDTTVLPRIGWYNFTL